MVTTGAEIPILNGVNSVAAAIDVETIPSARTSTVLHVGSSLPNAMWWFLNDWTNGIDTSPRSNAKVDAPGPQRYDLRSTVPSRGRSTWDLPVHSLPPVRGGVATRLRIRFDVSPARAVAYRLC